MEVLAKVTEWIRQLTELGLAIIMLGVVLQVLFGPKVAFMSMDVIGNVMVFVRDLGAEGLVGLVALWILWGIYSKKRK